MSRQPCPECNGIEFYRREVSAAAGGDGPDLRPGTGPFFGHGKFKIDLRPGQVCGRDGADRHRWETSTSGKVIRGPLGNAKNQGNRPPGQRSSASWRSERRGAESPVSSGLCWAYLHTPTR